MRIRERNHGLSAGAFWRLWERQGGRCGICRKPLSPALGKLVHVDHDWRCCPPGKKPYCGTCVRGLLCHECNTGRFGPYPDILRRAADWFEFGPIMIPVMKNRGSVFQLKNGRWALTFSSTTKDGKSKQVRRTFVTEEEAIKARLSGVVPPKRRPGKKAGLC